MEEKKEKKMIQISLKTAIALIIVIILAITMLGIAYYNVTQNAKKGTETTQSTASTNANADKNEEKNTITGNNNSSNVDEEESDKIVTDAEVKESSKKSFTDADVKESLEKYLNIYGTFLGGPSSVPVALKLVQNENEFKYIENSHTYETKIKYSDFKNKILEYMTEKEFENTFHFYGESEAFKNVNGNLYISAVGASGMQWHVESITKVSNESYKANITFEALNGDKTAQNVEFKTSNNNGKCVIDEIKWEEKTSSNGIQNLNTNDDLVKKLYGYVYKDRVKDYLDNEINLVYMNKKVTEADLNDKLKFVTVFSTLNENDGEKVEMKLGEYTEMAISSNVSSNGKSYAIKYSKETVENRFRQIFGKNAKINHQTIEYTSLGYVNEYKNNAYYCYSRSGGGGPRYREELFSIVKAEKDENNVYIYDQYALITPYDGEHFEGGCSLYAASDKSGMLVDNFEYSFLKKEVQKTGATDFNKEMIERLLPYGLPTYKHTFTKDTNGNYYWVSTEVVK